MKMFIDDYQDVVELKSTDVDVRHEPSNKSVSKETENRFGASLLFRTRWIRKKYGFNIPVPLLLYGRG